MNSQDACVLLEQELRSCAASIGMLLLQYAVANETDKTKLGQELSKLSGKVEGIDFVIGLLSKIDE